MGSKAPNAEVPARSMPPATSVDLQHDGFLWWINTALLHPLGYALAVSPHEPGEPHELWLYGPGNEPWEFGYEPGELDDLFARRNATLERARTGAEGPGGIINPDRERSDGTLRTTT